MQDSRNTTVAPEAVVWCGNPPHTPPEDRAFPGSIPGRCEFTLAFFFVKKTRNKIHFASYRDYTAHRDYP